MNEDANEDVNAKLQSSHGCISRKEKRLPWDSCRAFYSAMLFSLFRALVLEPAEVGISDSEPSLNPTAPNITKTTTEHIRRS
ncbi:hypothetical protein JHK84_027965 [Glycine max]|nr:hypothetical protein JHK85_028372 [Glycine max]KAG5151493.1 hypothetical protein JHK84_027965 [Glycine max]